MFLPGFAKLARFLCVLRKNTPFDTWVDLDKRKTNPKHVLLALLSTPYPGEALQILDLT